MSDERAEKVDPGPDPDPRRAGSDDPVTDERPIDECGNPSFVFDDERAVASRFVWSKEEMKRLRVRPAPPKNYTDLLDEVPGRAEDPELAARRRQGYLALASSILDHDPDEEDEED